jgi:RNA polymerase sigma factor for flagellar operon FliA
VELYEPLVTTGVARLPLPVRQHCEVADLQSYALFGLIDAIERFAPGSYASDFARFAAKRIRGAVYDELRRLDWLPRRVRSSARQYAESESRLAGELGRMPERAEVLADLGARNVAEVLAAVACPQVLHLDAGVCEGESSLLSSDAEAPESVLVRREEVAAVRRAVEELPERWRTVVELCFFGGHTQAEVGEILGVTASRICQIQAMALGRLRELLAA